MSLMKIAWYVWRMKNMHSGSPQIPGLHEARQSWATYTTVLGQGRLAEPLSTQIKTHFRVSSTPQSRSNAVVCVSTTRMCPRSRYFLVINYLYFQKAWLYHWYYIALIFLLKSQITIWSLILLFISSYNKVSSVRCEYLIRFQSRFNQTLYNDRIFRCICIHKRK